MQYPKHIQFHHAIGIARIKSCIAQCLAPSTERGTIFSDRFKVRLKFKSTLNFDYRFPDATLLIKNIFEG
jgi:hypothetical protein